MRSPTPATIHHAITEEMMGSPAAIQSDLPTALQPPPSIHTKTAAPVAAA
jgi:hypothetical protein